MASVPRPRVMRSSTALGERATSGEPTGPRAAAPHRPEPARPRRPAGGTCGGRSGATPGAGINSVDEGVGPSDPPQPGGALLGRALEGVPVARHDPEARPVAVRPLEVVEQAPVRVAAHVDALVDAV